REWAQQQLQRMLGVMKHESFYTTGTWSDEASGVYVGWTAHAGSFADSMPLRNERGDRVLVFSGEEDSPKNAIRSLGVDDASFPANLNGRFHGVVTDLTAGTATLFNDRFGMQRVYYHESPDGFYFAAEAKAILAVRPELRRIDTRSLGEFVSCGCV